VDRVCQQPVGWLPTCVSVGDVEFTCPRCQSPADAEFYGPCDDCCTVLRATIRADARAVDVAEYEPKMNVTPNAVALKDD
jgi:hypothetical protein